MISGVTRPQHNASRITHAIVSAACAMLSWGSVADDSATGKPVFTDREIQIIVSHGPWPAPARADPTNRASGKREAIELGTRLFFDQRLSGEGKVACGSCHVPERNWTDNLKRGVGILGLQCRVDDRELLRRRFGRETFGLLVLAAFPDQHTHHQM